MTFVLDASAMIAFLRDEPGAEVVSEIFFDSTAQIFAHALNFCEGYYDFHRAAGHHDAILAISAKSASKRTQAWLPAFGKRPES